MSNIRVIDENIYFSIIFGSEEMNADRIRQWFKDMVFFTPQSMSGTFLTKNKIKKYNEKAFCLSIQHDIKDDENYHFSVSDENKNMFKVMKSENFGVILSSLEKDKYEDVKDVLISKINTFFTLHKGVVAYACSGKDNFFQNLEDPEHYKIYGKSSSGLPLIKSRINPNWTEVDIECFPGHKHHTQGLWFGSCWAMWFGEEYFRYVPKEVLKSFKDCYENREIDNCSTRILLYENIWDYDKPENRERQWSFRRQVGIDEVAHRLMGINT